MLSERKRFYRGFLQKNYCALYADTTDFSRGKSGKKYGSFVSRNAINSAQLHSAASGDERVDRDNFHFPREYATPITGC